MVMLGCRVSTLFLKTEGVKGGERVRGKKEGQTERHCSPGQLMFGKNFPKSQKEG